MHTCTVFLRSTTDTSLESKLCGKEVQGTKPDAVEETPIKLKARGDTQCAPRSTALGPSQTQLLFSKGKARAAEIT